MERTLSLNAVKLLAALLAVLVVAGMAMCFAPVGQAHAATLAKSKVTSVASPAAGKVKLTAKKVKGAKGYQYVASTSKKFDTGSRYNLEFAQSKKRSYTLDGLKEGKTYYVRVRAYAGKNYGKWSAVKSVIVAKQDDESAELQSAKAEIEKLKSQLDVAQAEAKKSAAERDAAQAETRKVAAERDAAQAETQKVTSELNETKAALKKSEAEVDRLTAAINAAGDKEIPTMINYELDGGSLPDGTKTTLFKADGSYELPTPTKQGYDFQGWFDAAGNQVSSVTNLGHDVTVTAHWLEQRLAFTYIDSGRRSARETEWDEASQAYVGAQVYELFICDTTTAPTVGATYEGGSVVAVESAVDVSRPVGSVTLQTDAKFSELGLPSLIDCTSVDLSRADMSEVTNLSGLFAGCESLESVNLADWDTSSVTDMSGMFQECRVLTELDLSSLDTASVTNMHSMFAKCSSLTALDLSGFDTSNVEDMGYMFENCAVLESIDATGWNTAKAKDMTCMFYACKALTDASEANLNMANVVKARQMFSFCSSLEALDFSHSGPGRFEDMSAMFQMCSVKRLDISPWDTSRANMGFIFSGCSFTYLKTGEAFNSDASEQKPQVVAGLYAEDGVRYNYLPNGAHTYTSTKPTALASASI